MPPGTSAIIAIAEDRMIQQLEDGLEGYQKISRHMVTIVTEAEQEQ
jgi:hypothetical protein